MTTPVPSSYERIGALQRLARAAWRLAIEDALGKRDFGDVRSGPLHVLLFVHADD